MSALALKALTPRPAMSPTYSHHTRLGPRAHAAVSATSGVGDGLRLTRVGRLLVTGAIMCALITLSFLVFAGGATGSEVKSEVLVRPGQTLSHIAAEQLSDVSVATGVSMLREANDLATSQIQAGQTLVIPRR